LKNKEDKNEDEEKELSEPPFYYWKDNNINN
jgi:hypothetical protein